MNTALNNTKNRGRLAWFGPYGWMYEKEFAELADKECEAYMKKERIKFAALNCQEAIRNQFKFRTNSKKQLSNKPNPSEEKQQVVHPHV